MKMQDLIENAQGIAQNGVGNRAQFDEAMAVYHELAGNAAKAAAAAAQLKSLVKAVGDLAAEYAVGHRSVFTEPLAEVRAGVSNGVVDVNGVPYRLTVGAGEPRRISGANFTQEFLKRLPEAWCKASLKLNVGALAGVDGETLAKHGIKRTEKREWSVVESAA